MRQENIISAFVHIDENTTHLHLFFIPVVSSKDKNNPHFDIELKKQLNEIEESQYERVKRTINVIEKSQMLNMELDKISIIITIL